VFLVGERAWKLKRAVRFPYLDFSTPELRQAAFEAEFTLNQRSAPDLYLGVHPVACTDGGFAIGGAGEPVDWLLEMRRFPDGALLSDKASDGIDTHTLMRLADKVVALHAKAPPVRTKGAALMARVIDGNEQSFAAVADVLDRTEVAALIEAQRR